MTAPKRTERQRSLMVVGELLLLLLLLEELAAVVGVVRVVVLLLLVLKSYSIVAHIVEKYSQMVDHIDHILKY